ncbi:MAG: TonB family protein [Acidobacteriota bacterium]
MVETLDRRRVGAVGAARAVQAEPFQPAPPVETIAEELSISAATPEAEAARAGQEAPSALPSGSQLASQAPERTLPQPTASEPTESRLLVDSRPVEAQPSAPEPFKVGGVVKPPRRLVTPLPEYPDAAWARGVTGDVLVRAVIDERGKVADVEVLRGLPYGMTEAAVAAIERWRFAPATRHGEAVAVYRNLSVRFES